MAGIVLGPPIRQIPWGGAVFTADTGFLIGPHDRPLVKGPTRHTDCAGIVTTPIGWSPGRSLTLRSQQGGVTALCTYTVEPADRGSRLTLVADVDTRGAWVLAGPALRAVIRRSDRGQVDALARELVGAN